MSAYAIFETAAGAGENWRRSPRDSATTAGLSKPKIIWRRVLIRDYRWVYLGGDINLIGKQPNGSTCAMMKSESKGKARRATIAETLRTAIADSGENLAAIGRAAGIPQPVLWRFMAGERDLTTRTASKLLDFFGLEIRPKGKGR